MVVVRDDVESAARIICNEARGILNFLFWD